MRRRWGGLFNREKRRPYLGRRFPRAKLRPSDQHPAPPVVSLLLGIRREVCDHLINASVLLLRVELHERARDRQPAASCLSTRVHPRTAFSPLLARSLRSSASPFDAFPSFPLVAASLKRYRSRYQPPRGDDRHEYSTTPVMPTVLVMVLW